MHHFIIEYHLNCAYPNVIANRQFLFYLANVCTQLAPSCYTKRNELPDQNSNPVYPDCGSGVLTTTLLRHTTQHHYIARLGARTVFVFLAELALFVQVCSSWSRLIFGVAETLLPGVCRGGEEGNPQDRAGANRQPLREGNWRVWRSPGDRCQNGGSGSRSQWWPARQI